MDIDPATLKELYKTFSIEMEEQLQIIVSSLLLIEEKNQSSTDVKPEIDAMFRAAHTIKGAANSISFEGIAKIAHSLESIFSKIKNNEIEILPELIDLCLKSVDAMKMLTASYANDKKPDFNPSEIITLLEGYGAVKKIEITSEKQFTEDSRRIIDEKTSDTVTIQASKDSLRVDVQQLDKLSSMLDELNLSQLNISQSSKNFNHVVSINNQLIQSWKQLMREVSASLGGELPDAIDKLSQSSQDLLASQAILIDTHAKRLRNQSYDMSIQDELLQDEFRMLRLVPASVLFCTIPRHVRDLSHQLNKLVEVSIKGDDVKIDRMVLEAIKDPIIHLLRNAIDHGIEDIATRTSRGKESTGKLEIEISDQGSQIAIKIKDDGAGINFDSIKETAIKNKIINPENVSSLSYDDLINMLFMPGFSTRKEVTSLSGRGVGLDVVKSNLEKIKGTVAVSTVEGKSTTFTLLLPLTLSSERGLLVKSGDQQFAIPTISVDRILRIKKEDLIEVAGRQAIIVDNHTYPTYLLANLLELFTTEIADNEYLSAVILKKNQFGLLLLVDEIVGEHEIVIKQIQPPLTNIPCVSGGTLADGNQVVIVLNPHDLIQKASNKAVGDRIKFSDVKRFVQEKPNILVVDDSITTRTLEKNILESKNFNVSVAVNGKEAWDYIQKKQFSLIITDINMPVMDGFQLTEKIKQHEKFKNIPVIIVTSLDSEDEKRRGLEVGANAYIVKNEFESGALIEIVTQLV